MDNFDLRNELNQAKCLELVPLIDTNAILQDFIPPDDWITQFAGLIHKNLSSNQGLTIEFIVSKLNVQINNADGNTKFLNTLKALYGIFSENIKHPDIKFTHNQDSHNNLAEKLIEGISLCAPGYQNRIYLIWRGLTRVESLSAWLQVIRNDIVDQAFITLRQMFIKDEHDQAMEIHLYNQVAMMAYKLGLGINVINANDPYGLAISKSDITKSLIQAFKQKFTPLLIVNGIEAQIFSDLNQNFAYKGRNADGFASQLYLEGNEWLDKNFPPKCGEQRSVGYWFITNQMDNESDDDWLSSDNPRFLDFNWPKIRQAVLERLNDEHFFKEPVSTLQNIVDFENSDEFNYWAKNIAAVADPILSILLAAKTSDEQFNFLCKLLALEPHATTDSNHSSQWCGLLHLTTAPTGLLNEHSNLVFDALKELLCNRDAIILFNNELYFANQTMQTVEKVRTSEDKQAEVEQLKAKISETYKIADCQELKLITSITGRTTRDAFISEQIELFLVRNPRKFQKDLEVNFNFHNFVDWLKLSQVNQSCYDLVSRYLKEKCSSPQSARWLTGIFEQFKKFNLAEQQDHLIAIIADKLRVIIQSCKDKYMFSTWAKMILANPKLEQVLKETIKEKLLQVIRTTADFNFILKNNEYKILREMLDMLAVNFAIFVPSIKKLRNNFRNLNVDQQKAYVEAMATQFSRLILSSSDLKDLFAEEIDFYNVLIVVLIISCILIFSPVIIFMITMDMLCNGFGHIGNIANLGRIVDIFFELLPPIASSVVSPEARVIISNALIDQYPTLIKTSRDLLEVLKLIGNNAANLAVVLETVKEKLPNFILESTKDVANIIFDAMTPEQCADLYTQITGQPITVTINDQFLERIKSVRLTISVSAAEKQKALKPQIMRFELALVQKEPNELKIAFDELYRAANTNRRKIGFFKKGISCELLNDLSKIKCKEYLRTLNAALNLGLSVNSLLSPSEIKKALKTYININNGLAPAVSANEHTPLLLQN